MTTRSLLLNSLAAGLLAAASGAAHCALTVYDSQAEFLGVIAAPGTDGFDDLPVNDVIEGPLARHAGVHGYQVGAGPTANQLYAVGPADNPALSTNFAGDSIIFDSFSAGVSAIGGMFFATDVIGTPVPGLLEIVATDATGATSVVLLDAFSTSFLGFASDSALVELRVTSLSLPLVFVWPTVDDLVLGAVPETQTYALMLAGLGLLGWLARRRRR